MDRTMTIIIIVLTLFPLSCSRIGVLLVLRLKPTPRPFCALAHAGFSVLFRFVNTLSALPLFYSVKFLNTFLKIAVNIYITQSGPL